MGLYSTAEKTSKDYDTHPRWKKCRYFFDRYEEEAHKQSWKNLNKFSNIIGIVLAPVAVVPMASAPHIGIDILKHEYNGAFNTENFSRTSPKEFFTQFEECLAAE